MNQRKKRRLLGEKSRRKEKKREQELSSKGACTHAVTLDLCQTYKLGMWAMNSEQTARKQKKHSRHRTVNQNHSTLLEHNTHNEVSQPKNKFI